MVGEPQVRFDRMPAVGPITGHFGDQFTDGNRNWAHRGLDIGCPSGTPVYTPASGVVVDFTNDGSFGVGACLDHGDGWYTLYAHLSRRDVSLGQTVSRGQQLGLSGATGYVSGAHLHWQLCDSPTFPTDIGHSRDPLKYFMQEEPMTPAERGLMNIAWGDFQRAYDCYYALRRLDPGVEPQAVAIRNLLPDEGIETAFSNMDQGDDLNAAMVMRGRLTTLVSCDIANDIYRILGGQP